MMNEEQQIIHAIWQDEKKFWKNTYCWARPYVKSARR